ncbi:hypothetical protein PY093_04095 [Cytobacillus sp. S13-E01]|uniref:hypothetical protein n=1 Tax=Cytobacillus sp. S13-E01 TaxID=3031326 RepID=UPI0023D824D1|nr:hypothetical protein [Cytobacillus sp. S13-E01]MDF0725895.1 hypothetical protein [Cytobacillus sp. S13-E01]
MDAQKDKISTLEATLSSAADSFGENDRTETGYRKFPKEVPKDIKFNFFISISIFGIFKIS